MTAVTTEHHQGNTLTLLQEESRSQQIHFARHVYDTQQALLRQLDTKAGVMLSILVFLTGAVIPLTKDVAPKLRFAGSGSTTSWVFALSAGVLVIGVVGTAFCTQQVITPRGLIRGSMGRPLMFAEDIVSHPNSEDYHEATVTASSHTLLQTLTAEVYQLGAIAKTKMWWLRMARWPIGIATLAWAANTICTTYLFTWR